MLHFWNLIQILNILKKKMIAIATAFPKLLTVKNLLIPLSEKGQFSTRFDSQHLKASQTLAKSLWEPLYLVFSSFSGKFI